ncbi:MAG: hypothetical protein ACOX6T_12380 [Myxococcales bacterium]|jgi:hypothetical protein
MGLGGALAQGLGVGVPALPAGVTAEKLMPWTMLSVLLLAVALAPLAALLRAPWAFRAAALALFVYAATFVNNALEARIFMTSGAAAGAGVAFTLVVYLPASALLAISLAFLGRREGGNRLGKKAALLVASGVRSLGLRLAIAWAAFPAIYLACGLAVQPFIERWYREGLLEMRQPGWSEILPTLAARSLVFLLACGPVIVAAAGGRRRLWARLGPALFIAVGGFHMLQAYWLPAALRGPHVLELLASTLAYAAVLALLFVAPASAASTEPCAPAA